MINSRESKIKSIQRDLSYLDKDFLAKMDLFFWEKEQIKETMYIDNIHKKGLPLSVNNEDFYVNNEGNFVTLSEVNRRLLNTVEQYRQDKNAKIDELKKNGAYLTGRSEYECYCL